MTEIATDRKQKAHTVLVRAFWRIGRDSAAALRSPARAGLATASPVQPCWLHMAPAFSSRRKPRRRLASDLAQQNTPAEPGYFAGGSDGIRTRDLLRDRETC